MSGGVTLYGPWGFCGPDVTDAAMRLLTTLIENLVANGATVADVAGEAAARAAGDTALAAVAAGKVAIDHAGRPVIADAAVVAVAGMADTVVTDTSAVCVLGVLGEDLYLFGSQNDPTGGGPAAGSLAGVWRFRDGAWSFLGKAQREVAVNEVHNYNRLEEWGAVAYNDKLYIGDRHTGKLYRLDLNLDGSLYRVTRAGQVGNEDIFPGPVFAGRLPLGTFGAIGMPADMPGLFTYDGTTVANIFLSAAIGNLGYVNSMALHGGYLWVHLRNGAGTYFEMWRVDSTWAATLVWSGDLNHKLVGTGASLVAVEWRDTAPISDARWVSWRDGAWQTLSAGMGAVGDSSNPPDVRAAWMVGDRLYAASYYHGIFEFVDQGFSKVVGAPPRVQSVTVLGDTTWIMGTNPTALYRTPSRLPVPPEPNPDEAPLAVTALPFASAGNRGVTVVLLGDGITTADVVYQCRRNASGIYEWVPVTVGAGVIPMPADPALLYDGASLVGADGTAIASWADLSALAIPITQADVAKRPTMQTVSGIRVGRFDGVNDFLQATAGGAHIQPMTTILVARLLSVAATRYLMDAGAGFASHVLYGGAGNWNMYAAAAGPVGPASNTSWHIFVATFAESASRLRVDGGAGTGATLPAQSRTGITLGAASSGILAAPVDIAEAISYDRRLSLDELNAAGTSLAARFAALGVTWTTAT